jgi:hypothetical protein
MLQQQFAGMGAAPLPGQGPFSWQQQPHPSATQAPLPGMHQLGGWAGRVGCAHQSSMRVDTVLRVAPAAPTHIEPAAAN